MTAFPMHANGRAFCCAGILCSVSRQLKPIEKLMMKLCNVAGIYSVSRIWADSDKKMRIYSSASMAENHFVMRFCSSALTLMFFLFLIGIPKFLLLSNLVLQEFLKQLCPAFYYGKFFVASNLYCLLVLYCGSCVHAKSSHQQTRLFLSMGKRNQVCQIINNSCANP